jgi:hypothetical protein
MRLPTQTNEIRLVRDQFDENPIPNLGVHKTVLIALIFIILNPLIHWIKAAAPVNQQRSTCHVVRCV